MLPVMYIWQPPTGRPQEVLTIPTQFFNCWHRGRCFFHWFSLPRLHWISRSPAFEFTLDSLDLLLDFAMDSPSQPPSTPAPTSPAVDICTHHSCHRCARRMSRINYGKHTICIHCRDVRCSIDVRCSVCSSWSLVPCRFIYFSHRNSLVSIGKKKQVSTALILPLRCRWRYRPLAR